MKIIAVFFTVICVLVLDILCQLSTYQSRYRPDCEYKQCMKPIRNHGNCPRWGSCQWYCQAKFANCTVGTRYHCARDQRNLEQFTNACAVEIFCLSGEEPHLSVQESTGKASVNCRPCYKNNVYNSRLNTSSATFSECKMLKKNLCKKEDNKIDCGNQNYAELTKTDGYCRCDARNGYAARSPKKCFYEYEVCFVKKCPEGMELLLNYTCGMLCPTGYARQPASDICTKVSVTRPFTSDRPELNFTDVQTTSIRTLDAPSTNEQLYKQIIIPICLSVVVFVITIVTILFRIHLKGVPDTGTETNITSGKTVPDSHRPREAQTAIPMDSDSGAQLAVTAVTEPRDIPGVGPMKYKEVSIPTAIGTHENKNTSVRAKPSHDISTAESDSEGLPGQKLCEVVHAFLKKENVFEENRCLHMINTHNIFNFDTLKEKGIIKPDTTLMRTIKEIKVDGFIAYEMPGEETSCIYEFMSNMLFGNADMKYIMRLAAMRYALQNFGKYMNKLTGEFLKGKNFSSRVHGAKLFFKIHSIEFNETGSSWKEEWVRNSFTDLVREIANTGQGPFYVEFLRGSLNCTIMQLIESGLYEPDLSKIPGLNVTLTTSLPPERELHIYRKKTSSRGLSNNYKRVLLLKNDEEETYV